MLRKMSLIVIGLSPSTGSLQIFLRIPENHKGVEAVTKGGHGGEQIAVRNSQYGSFIFPGSEKGTGVEERDWSWCWVFKGQVKVRLETVSTVSDLYERCCNVMAIATLLRACSTDFDL